MTAEHANVLPIIDDALVPILQVASVATLPDIISEDTALPFISHPTDRLIEIPSALPLTIDAYKQRVSDEVAMQLVYNAACNALDDRMHESGERSWEELPDWYYDPLAVEALRARITQSAGFDAPPASDPPDKAYIYLTGLSEDDFADWWQRHAEQIRTCSLTMADFE